MSTSAVKNEVEESPDLTVNLEEKILELCRLDPTGIADIVLEQAMPGIEVTQKVKAINGLLTRGKIDLVKVNGILLYRGKDPAEVNDLKGSDDQERLVYQIIKQSGNKGIWVRDIRRESGLAPPQMNKILKKLENKKAIKAIKTVGDSKKKVYMLFDLEPDRSVTGGAWYSDQDFDVEFVNVLNQMCYKFLQDKAATAANIEVDPITKRKACFASSEDVWNYITKLGLLSNGVQLGVDDIETILNTLIYDGKVEVIVSTGQAGTVPSISSKKDGTDHKKLFRAIQPLTEPAALMRIPCGVCPVFDNCYEGGAVSPSTCIYMKEWMQY